MGERVLAAFGFATAMDGVLAAWLSAVPTSVDSAASSTAEWTGSSEQARLRTLCGRTTASSTRSRRGSPSAPDRYKARLSLHLGDVHGADSPDPPSSAATRSAKHGTQG